MTQEEKARAYDEALERAQKATRAGSDVAMDIVQYIFPQLAESEDERIRKALVWHLKADVDFVSNGVTKAECLAYLEKQKSQKPWEWSEEETKVLDSIIDDYEKAAKSFCGYDGKIGLLRAIRNGEYDLSKQEWNDGKNILEDIIVFVSGYADKRVVTKWVSFLKSLRPQPRQAWSEEDERMRKGLINFLRSSFIKENITDEMVAPWIAYLEKQKSAEWSEVELLFRGEKVTVKRPFYRDDKGRGYSTTEQDEEVAWNALRAWCGKKGISLYDLYPKAEWSEEDEK